MVFSTESGQLVWCLSLISYSKWCCQNVMIDNSVIVPKRQCPSNLIHPRRLYSAAKLPAYLCFLRRTRHYCIWMYLSRSFNLFPYRTLSFVIISSYVWHPIIFPSTLLEIESTRSAWVLTSKLTYIIFFPIFNCRTAKSTLNLHSR